MYDKIFERNSAGGLRLRFRLLNARNAMSSSKDPGRRGQSSSRTLPRHDHLQKQQGRFHRRHAQLLDRRDVADEFCQARRPPGVSRGGARLAVVAAVRRECLGRRRAPRGCGRRRRVSNSLLFQARRRSALRVRRSVASQPCRDRTQAVVRIRGHRRGRHSCGAAPRSGVDPGSASELPGLVLRGASAQLQHGVRSVFRAIRRSGETLRLPPQLSGRGRGTKRPRSPLRGISQRRARIPLSECGF